MDNYLWYTEQVKIGWREYITTTTKRELHQPIVYLGNGATISSLQIYILQTGRVETLS